MKQIPRFKEVSKEQADGMGWAFDNPESTPRPYYFKFPVLQPHQVRIRVLYSSICLTDVKLVRKGVFGNSQPIIPGHQVVGRIEALGNQVSLRKIGDIVGVGFRKGSCNNCKECFKGFDNLCRNFTNMRTIYPDVGGFSTHLHAYEDWAFLLPSNIELQNAPPLLCAGISTFNPLKTHCKKGDKVGIVGIGGLGHLGVMFGSKMQIEVVAFSRSEDKQKESLQFGAKNFIISTEENLKKEQGKYDVMILTTEIKPSDFVLYLRLLKSSGKICLLAVSAVAPETPFMQMTGNQYEIHGVVCGTKIYYHEMLKLCGDHKITAKCEHYDFMDFAKGFERTEKGNPHFRVVLKVPENIFNK